MKSAVTVAKEDYNSSTPLILSSRLLSLSSTQGMSLKSCRNFQFGRQKFRTEPIMIALSCGLIDDSERNGIFKVYSNEKKKGRK